MLQQVTLYPLYILWLQTSGADIAADEDPGEAGHLPPLVRPSMDRLRFAYQAALTTVLMVTGILGSLTLFH